MLYHKWCCLTSNPWSFNGSIPLFHSKLLFASGNWSAVTGYTGDPRFHVHTHLDDCKQFETWYSCALSHVLQSISGFCLAGAVPVHFITCYFPVPHMYRGFTLPLLRSYQLFPSFVSLCACWRQLCPCVRDRSIRSCTGNGDWTQSGYHRHRWWCAEICTQNKIRFPTLLSFVYTSYARVVYNYATLAALRELACS